MKGPTVPYPEQMASHEPPEIAQGSTARPVTRATGGTTTIDWASVDDDVEIALANTANLLITGPELLVMKVMLRVMAGAPAGIVIPCEVGRLPLSPLPLPPGSVVFRDIDALDVDGQALLLLWLESVGAGRLVVSTASTSLLPLVTSGAFDSRLFYRLNTVHIDVRRA
jgi:hypothetical protein